MNNHQNTPAFDRSISDQAYDLLGQLLAEQETERLLKELEEADDSNAEMNAFFAKQEKAHLRLIRRSFRRERLHTFARQTLPKAAMIVAAVAIIGSVAIANPDLFQTRSNTVHYEIDEEWLDITMDGSTQGLPEPPSGWMGNNYLGYIPQGLEISDCFTGLGNNYITFTDPDNGEVALDFFESGPSGHTRITVEGALVSPVTINGYEGVQVVKDDMFQICWDDGVNYFVLKTNGLFQQESIRIAESLYRLPYRISPEYLE